MLLENRGQLRGRYDMINVTALLRGKPGTVGLTCKGRGSSI